MVLGGLVGGLLLGLVSANYPQFDANTQMRSLLLPSDARVGSVIYRLRAIDSDRDYPLHFAATDYGSYVVRVEDLPCNRSSPACEANVYLERSVSPGQLFKFRLTVKDTAGDTTTQGAAIKVTDGATDFQSVFPHVPGVIMIPEDTKVGTELEYVIVRKHPRSLRAAKLELVGADEFTISQSPKKDTTTGLILLSQPLDYEIKTMYKLSVYATGMWTDIETDTRNIAGFELVVVVTDVQDTPPIWDAIPPVTNLSPNLTKGDIVLKVTARDGDRGSPREVRYAIAAEKNPFTVFFSIDEISGEIRLGRELRELTSVSRSHQPILLTVMAEEVDKNGGIGDSSTATVALILGELANTPPYFESNSYVARIPENSPQGTALTFGDPYIATVRDNDMGKQGVFSLSLENNNGTFEISPNVGEREADFVVRVRDNRLLDFEARKLVTFEIWAREVSPVEKPLSSSVQVAVYLEDVNDNPPVFLSSNYTAEAPENITAGFRLTRVEATDLDSGDFGVVRYTSIIGAKNGSLSLHPESGVIAIATDSHGFDREESSMYQFLVEARDDRGMGNRATVPFTLIVLDVNDNVPRFTKNPMDFILGPEGYNFSQKAFIVAVDDDAEPPNNIVRYEILSGNYGNRFILDDETGELRVNPQVGRVTRQTTALVATLLVRAYDLGVPSLWTTGEVRIFPAESQARTMRFLLPGRDLDPRKVEGMLSQFSGASRVIIHSIQPYRGQALSSDSTDLSPPNQDGEKSIVTATILYNNNAVVDLAELQKKFALHRNSTTVVVNEKVVHTATERSDAAVIFWILLILLLLLLLLLLMLLLCFFCSCCPCYSQLHNLVKQKTVLTSSAVALMAAQKEKLPERENKSVQAEWVSGNRRDAWSAEERRRGWGLFTPPRRFFVLPGRYQTVHQIEGPTPAPRRPPQPSVIFTREVTNNLPTQEKPRLLRQEPLLLEDIDGTEYQALQTLDAGRLERREAPTRQGMFIRDGGAEILRLVTRGKSSEEEPRLNQPQRPFTLEQREVEGKATIMKRFINDTNGHVLREDDTIRATEEDSRTEMDESILEQSKREDLMKKVMDMDVDRDLSTADVNRLTTIQRDILLTRFLVEEQRRGKLEDTQSLPGVVTMATQTDQNAQTQTDKDYFKRRSKSDNDDSASEDETVRRRFRRKRFREEGYIKSPIMEEGEDSKPVGVQQNKASLIRQAALAARADEELRSTSEMDPKASRRREILRSLQVTPVKQVNITNNVLVEHVTHQEPPQRKLTSQTTYDVTDSSLEPSSASRSRTKTKEDRGRGGVRTQPTSREASRSPSKDHRSLSHGRATPRYMDWYKTKKEEREKSKRDEKDVKYQRNNLHPKQFNPYLKNYGRRRKKGEESPPDERSPRGRKVMINASPREGGTAEKRDDDKDSGIALPYNIGPSNLKNQHALEKKSIFTIAYDDMETKQIRIDSASSP